MSIRVNGTTVSRAFLRAAGSWRPVVAAWARVNGTWRKVYPYVPPAPPITGASISPTSRQWTQNTSSDFRAGFTGSASGGTGPFYYAWSADGDAFVQSGQGSANVVIRSPSNTASTVRLTIEDQGSGTAATATPRSITTIPVVQPLAASVSPTSRDWSGSLNAFTASFTGSASGGSGSYSFNWTVSNGGTIQSGQGTASVTVASNNGQAVTVTLTVSDTSSGQSTTASGSVAAKVWPTLTVSASPTSLSGSGSTSPVTTSGSATATVSGGSGSFTETWEWDGGASTGSIVPVNSGSRTTAFRSGDTQNPGTSRGAGFRYRVTDNVTGTVVVSNSVGINLTRTAAPLVVSVSPSSLSGSSTSAPVETTGSATVSVSGGSGSWTVAWVYDGTGTGGLNPVSNAATTKFRGDPAQPAGATYTAGFFPRITDTVTGQTADGPSVSITLTRNYTPITATLTTYSLSGSGTSAPVLSSGEVTINATGGSGDYRYFWNVQDGVGTGGITVTDGTGRTVRASTFADQPPGTTRTGGIFAAVIDNVTGLEFYTPVANVSLSRNYTTMTASASPGSLSGSSTSTPVVTSGSATCTVSGGSGNVSYQWEWDGGASSGSIVPVNTGSQSTAFQSGDTQAPGTSRGAGFRCRVTDNVTGQVVVTNSVGVNLTRTAAEIFFVEVTGDSFWSQTGAFTGTANVGAAVTGGRAPYSYSWASEGGVGITFSPNGQQATTVGTTNRAQTGSVKVTVTDADNRTTVSSLWLIEPAG